MANKAAPQKPAPKPRVKISLNPKGLLKSVVERKQRMNDTMKEIEKSERS